MFVDDLGAPMSAFDPTDLVVYVDGEYVGGHEARVSVFDHGFLYGDGVFEGLRVFDGSFFRPRDHLARLARSARAISLDLPLGQDELLAVLAQVVHRSGLKDAHVRPLVTRGFGAPGMDPARAHQPSVVVAAYFFPPLLGEDALRLVTSSVVRKAPRSIGAHIKSLNYLDAILAKQQANAVRMDDAIMLDGQGAVAECTSTNIFAVFEGTLATPSTRAALPGITRRTILELARERSIPHEERDIWPMDLYGADAVFITGSGAGVVAVGEIDGRELATEAHPLFRELREAYLSATADSRFLVSVASLLPAV